MPNGFANTETIEQHIPYKFKFHFISSISRDGREWFYNALAHAWRFQCTSQNSDAYLNLFWKRLNDFIVAFSFKHLIGARTLDYILYFTLSIKTLLLIFYLVEFNPHSCSAFLMKYPTQSLDQNIRSINLRRYELYVNCPILYYTLKKVILYNDVFRIVR